MLLSEAIESLLIATKADGRSLATVGAYRRKLKPLLAFLGDVAVETITTDDLRRFIADQMERPTLYADHPMHRQREGRLSPHTIAGRVRALKRLFNWLEAEGVISDNPMRRIRTPRPKQRKPKAIDLQDFLALLAGTEGNAVADRRDRAVILALADTGARVGGLCVLRVPDVDFDRGLVSLTEKGERARLVPFTETTSAALRAWLEVRPQGRGPWLFMSLSARAKGRLTPSGVAQMLRRRARAAGITGRVNPHSFRHMFAREFLLAGGDLSLLSDLMGHSSVQVTKDSYGIFTVSDLQEAHRRFSPVARMGKDGHS